MSELDKKFKELLNQSKTFYDNGEEKKAIELLLKAIELNLNQEEKAEIWGIIGGIYEDSDIEEAIRTYLKCIELAPNSFHFHNKLGEAYKDNGQYEKAIESLLKAVELNPNQKEKAEILDSIGEIYYYNSKYEKAIQTYLKCIELAPNSNYYYYLNSLGYAYFGLIRAEHKQHKEAMKIFLKLIELKPNIADYWAFLAFSHVGECTKALLRSTELAPNDEAKLYRLAELYEFNYQYEEAIQTYLKCIELDPDSYYKELGKAYEKNQQYEKAIESYLEDIKLHPDIPKNYILLGDAYIANDQYKDAIKAFEKVIELLK